MDERFMIPQPVKKTPMTKAGTGERRPETNIGTIAPPYSRARDRLLQAEMRRPAMCRTIHSAIQVLWLLVHEVDTIRKGIDEGG